MTQPVPTSLLREAYRSAGEKRWPLGRLAWRALLGRDYGVALLGFAYLKQLDDRVDTDPDGGGALALLAAQRDLLAAVYSSADSDPVSLATPEAWGARVFRFDRERGSVLRPLFEAIFETMEFDARRRGRVIPRAELEAYEQRIGAATLRYFAHFTAPGQAFPDAFAEAASRAYLGADCLMDLAEDLEGGLINVPAEDLARLRLSPTDLPDRSPAARRWCVERTRVVDAAFLTAARERRSLEPLALRVLCRAFLGIKERKFRRFAKALR